MGMLQFSTRRLLASCAIIAAGCGCWCCSRAIFQSTGTELSSSKVIVGTVLYFCTGLLIGAGIFNLAKRADVGAILGMIAMAAVPMIWAFAQH